MSGRYPSSEELAQIANWPMEDSHGLFNFIASIWCWPDMAWSPSPQHWSLATGGWSGNEDIIGALKENRPVWLMCWESSNRGGLHTFILPPIKEN